MSTTLHGGEGTRNWFSETTDSHSTILGAGYWNKSHTDLKVGDTISVNVNNADTYKLVVTGNSGGTVTVIDSGNTMVVNNQTDTTYAPTLLDGEATMITLTNGSAVTVTIPANASVAFPIGTTLNFYQGGAGAVTIAITSDTLNVNATYTTVLAAQYAVAHATKLAATTWVLYGDLTAA